MRSSIFTIYLTVLCVAAMAIHAEDDEPCGEDDDCEEIVVVGEREESSTPNSNPTPSSGSNAPTNSSSEACVGSGCINYEESYENFFGPTECDEGYYRDISYWSGVARCVPNEKWCEVLEFIDDHFLTAAAESGGCTVECSKHKIFNKNIATMAACVGGCVVGANQLMDAIGCE